MATVTLKSPSLSINNDPLGLYSCGGSPVHGALAPRVAEPVSCLLNQDVAWKLSCVQEMLHLTQPNKVWRRPFLGLLQPCITEGELRKTLAFLEHVISLAKEALQRHQEKAGILSSRRFPARQDNPILLYIDTSLAPKTMSENRWKEMLIALGFEIEEPDGFHDISDVSVSVSPDAVLPVTLDGMLILMKLLEDLPWTIIGMVLRFDARDALFLSTVLQSQDVPHERQKGVRQLWDSYPDQMEELGFQRTRSSFSRSQSATADQLGVVFKALFSEDDASPGVFV